MTPIPLDPIIKAITTLAGSATPLLKNKLERKELVIKLLKKFNLDPEHPPAYFSGVYQYALVEYGIGKPQPILELFRQKEIQQVLRQAFDRNNPSLLLKEADQFLSWHRLGDEIRELRIDPRREFYEFAAVFIEIAKRTRTPAEVLTNQKLDSLHQRISDLQQRLDRLPTAEGIRTEIAQLLQGNYPALQVAEPSIEKKCRAFVLDQENIPPTPAPSSSSTGATSFIDYSSIQEEDTLPKAYEKGKDLGVGSLAVSLDGKLLAAGYWDGTVKLFDTTTWEVVEDFEQDLERHKHRISSVAFTPDGETLVTASYDKTVKLWEIPTGEFLCELADHTKYIEAIAISPNGERLATASWDGTSQIYHYNKTPLHKWKKLYELDRIGSEVMSVSFCPSDNGTLAVACYDGTVQLWDLERNDRLDYHKIHKWNTGVLTVAFSLDSRILASGGEDNTIKLCEWRERKIAKLKDSLSHKANHSSKNSTHEPLVYSLAFSPDGKTLASGNWNGTIQLWDSSTGEPLKHDPLIHEHELDSDSVRVISVTFSSDGKLISGDDSGTIKIWSA